MAEMAQGMVHVVHLINTTHNDNLKYQAMCMNAKYARKYCSFQTYEASVLLRDLMHSPNGYKKHFERCVSCVESITAH